MKRTGNQQLLLALGLMLTMMGGAIGLIVGMNNLSLWITTLALGIVLILRSFIFERESFDEREQLISYKSYRSTFMMTIVIGFILYSLYYFDLIHLDAADALVTYLALIILFQGISSLFYARRV